MSTDPGTGRAPSTASVYGARPGDGARAGDPREALLAEISQPGRDAPRRSRAALDAADPRRCLRRTSCARRRSAKRADAGSRVDRDARAGRRRADISAPWPLRRRIELDSMASAAPSDMPSEPRWPVRRSSRPFAPTPRRGCSAPARRRSVSSNGWSRSGPIIFACPSPRATSAAPRRALSSAKRSVRMRSGRFADMLQAVEQHPAMLNFLDNAQSIGPEFARRPQQQIAASTRIWRAKFSNCTRWASAPATRRPTSRNSPISSPAGPSSAATASSASPAPSLFDPNAPRAARRRVRGRLYLQDGVAQGEAALDDHRARAGDGQPYRAQARAPFRRRRTRSRPRAATGRDISATDGDLAAVARALVDRPRRLARAARRKSAIPGN